MSMTVNSLDEGTPVLSLQGIHKTFGGVVAIDRFTLDIFAGEVVALVGDNGAGKSTLIKIIAGVHLPTEGRILIDGNQVLMSDPSDSQTLGIQVVYQDLALADNQPVYMNMFLGRELVVGLLRRLDRKKMMAETELLVKQLGCTHPVGSRNNPRSLGRSKAGRRDREGHPLGLQDRSHG